VVRGRPVTAAEGGRKPYHAGDPRSEAGALTPGMGRGRAA